MILKPSKYSFSTDRERYEYIIRAHKGKPCSYCTGRGGPVGHAREIISDRLHKLGGMMV